MSLLAILYIPVHLIICQLASSKELLTYGARVIPLVETS